jgi:hypothetical protein
MARGRSRGRSGPDYMDILDIQVQAIPETFILNNGMLSLSGSEIMFHGKAD